MWVITQVSDFKTKHNVPVERSTRSASQEMNQLFFCLWLSGPSTLSALYQCVGTLSGNPTQPSGPCYVCFGLMTVCLLGSCVSQKPVNRWKWNLGARSWLDLVETKQIWQHHLFFNSFVIFPATSAVTWKDIVLIVYMYDCLQLCIYLRGTCTVWLSPLPTTFVPGITLHSTKFLLPFVMRLSSCHSLCIQYIGGPLLTTFLSQPLVWTVNLTWTQSQPLPDLWAWLFEKVGTSSRY